MSQIYLSYIPADAAWVDRLGPSLQATYGSVILGAALDDSAAEATIAQSAVVLVLLSSQTAQSAAVQRDLESAARQGIPALLVLLYPAVSLPPLFEQARAQHPPLDLTGGLTNKTRFALFSQINRILNPPPAPEAEESLAEPEPAESEKKSPRARESMPPPAPAPAMPAPAAPPPQRSQPSPPLDQLKMERQDSARRRRSPLVIIIALLLVLVIVIAGLLVVMTSNQGAPPVQTTEIAQPSPTPDDSGETPVETTLTTTILPLLIAGVGFGSIAVILLLTIRQNVRDKANRPLVFLSYRRDPSWGQARCIADSLRDRGINVFMDVDSINEGKFAEVIQQAITHCNYFVPILAPTTLDSEWVVREISHALEHSRPIIPLLVDGFRFDAATLPDSVQEIASHNAITVTHEFYDAAIERLATRFIRAASDTA